MKALYPFLLISLVIAMSLNAPAEKQSKPGIIEKSYRFEKVLEFSDVQDDFYFKYPDYSYQRQIEVDADENIYVLDYNRILKFTPQGEYVKEFPRQGEGPGEVGNPKTFRVIGNEIIIFQPTPGKIIHLTTNGKLVNEFRIQNGFDNLLAVYGDHFYFWSAEYPEIKKSGEQVIEVEQKIYRVSEKGEAEPIKNCSFPKKVYVIQLQGLGMIDIDNSLYLQLKDRYCIVSNTAEYGIKLVDLDKKAVTASFKRKDYKRQELTEDVNKVINAGAVIIGDKVYRKPPQKYLPDVQQMLAYKDNLWVVTTTVDEQKGVLVDAFSQEGKYIESFYLKLSDRWSRIKYFTFFGFIHGDYLFTVERDKEDNPYIVKYKITPAGQ